MGSRPWRVTGFLLLLLTGCAAGDGDAALSASPAAGATTGEAVPNCVEEIQQQVTDLLAAFDDAGNAGPADGEAYRRLVELSPDQCPEWDGAAAADILDEEARRRLEGFAASGAELGPEEYAAITGRAILAAALRPARTFDVPGGFPEEFPVVDGAQLVHATHDGEVVTATWEVAATEGFETVCAFYESALQEGVIGRWTADRATGSVMQGAGSAVAGEQLYEVNGYGLDGTVEITMAEGDQVITIEARLAPDE